MAKKWQDVRKKAVESGLLNEERIEAHKKRMLAEARAYRLAEVRRAHGLNQEDLAGRLEISQSRVSRIERGDLDAAQIATLRAYVHALGGELEIAARFGDELITVG